MGKKSLVFICSPYSGDIETNTAKAIRYCGFAYSQNAVPYAPHLHNPQFLSEEIPQERCDGINLGIELLSRVDELWCFGSKLTAGMKEEINFAIRHDIPIMYFTDKCVEVEND